MAEIQVGDKVTHPAYGLTELTVVAVVAGRNPYLHLRREGDNQQYALYIAECTLVQKKPTGSLITW